MTGVGRPYGHPVHVALLVIEHGLGPDHAGDRVDGEDVVAVRVSVCSEKRSQVVRTEIFPERWTDKITPGRLFLLLRTRERARDTETFPDICAVDPEKNHVREIDAAIERGMKCLTWTG